MRRRLFLSLVGATCALGLAVAGTANAEVHWKFSFGESGSGAGQFNQPAGIAIDQSTGDVYVADRLNERIQEFTPTGSFIRAWGYDVVASGEDNEPPANEVQSVRIKGSSGTFSLGFSGQSTAAIPYNATAAEVETALNALTSINAGGGSVSVTGGPGDATGSTPYTVTFDGGPMAGGDRAQLTINRSDLGIPVGTQLSCSPQAARTSSFTYQWLANGAPIGGATSATYTTAPGDAGMVIQCQATGAFEQLFKVAETNRGYHVVSPAPGTAPPIPHEAELFSCCGSAYLQASGDFTVGGPGGGQLTCTAGSWTQGPTEYTYRWYRNGQPIASTTTASTSSVYTVTAADVETAASFQCSVTGLNVGGGSAVFTRWRTTEPPPNFANVELPTVAVTEVGVNTGVLTTLNGGPVFEVCEANPPSTDVCKAGVRGGSLGQFNRPRGIAVDQVTGDVYVGDDRNFRVQKFTATGTRVATFGKMVDQTTGAGTCTAVSGDICGEGVRSFDATPGTFGGWPTGGLESPEGGSQELEFRELGNSVAVDSSGNVYVTDPYLGGEGSFIFNNKPRVQKFDSSGNYVGQIFTSGAFGEAKPIAVAADGAGNVYTSFGGEQAAVNIAEPPEFTPEGTERTFVERHVLHEDNVPKQIAVDPIDQKIWLTDRNQSNFENTPPNHVCGEEGSTARPALLAYDFEGHRLECSSPSGLGALSLVSGFAISSSRLAYASLKSQNKVKVFELPADTAPSVGAESVSRITTETARVEGAVNPGFEPTSFTLEYGLGDCEVSSCASVPGTTNVYGVKDVSVEIPVAGLEPGTKYHYRIVAENSHGTDFGADRTFVTFPFVDLVNDPCPNALARKQTRTAGALDCRAYELASAGFTGGYDVVSDLAPGQTPFEGYPDAPGRLLYSVRDGGIPGTGSPTNRGPDPYVATRGQSGWTTKYVGIPADAPSEVPFSSTVAGTDSGLSTFAFGGPEICNPCFADGTAGMPIHMPNGTLVQGMLGPLAVAPPIPTGDVRKALSGDGTHFVFGSLQKFVNGANNDGTNVTLYDRNLSAGTTQIASTLPNGSTIKAGQDVTELDISGDGTKVLIGRLVPTGEHPGGHDSDGNSYWHLYMHVGTSTKSVDLTEGTTNGVLYDGMTSDGSKVFFTTRDQLLPTQDTDSSADIYEADVSGGSATVHLVTVGQGEPSNNDGCEPVGEPRSWNAVSGAGQCDAVGLPGGSGVASQNGTFYFLSPELLQGAGNGDAGEPNLYVATPGASGPNPPQFVATVDNSLAKAPPPPPAHPVQNASLVSGLSAPESLAIDQSTGDIYVAERGNSSVDRYTSAGAPHNFTAGPNAGSNKLTGQTLGTAAQNELAVDNASGSPFEGALYVTSNSTTVRGYASDGEELGTLTGFGQACGVAVDESTGTLYVGDFAKRLIWRFDPKPAATKVENGEYTVTSLKTEEGFNPCQVAADTVGDVYASKFTAGPLRVFESGDFSASPEEKEGREVTVSGSVPPSNALATDPQTDELYVDTGSKIAILDSTQTPLKVFGSGSISGSRGVAVNQSTKHVYAVNGSNIVEFGIEPEPYEPIDEPLVVDAVSDNAGHRYGDFQVAADGRYALFTTRLPLDESYDNAGHRMVYRYDNSAHQLACASCLPTEGRPTADAVLPEHGSGLTNDGRVFFDSVDQLVMRDTNGKLDAYEWNAGNIALISTGFSNFPSDLLTVSSDGKDAFFFTRETLVPSDENGQAMKLYDAREGGGFFVIPASPPCAASDECHGPGSQAAPPPPIGTFKGTGGQHARSQVTCRKGFVKRHGKCVRKRPKRHRRRHHRGGSR